MKAFKILTGIGIQFIPSFLEEGLNKTSKHVEEVLKSKKRTKRSSFRG